jgi:hypothetical protein
MDDSDDVFYDTQDILEGTDQDDIVEEFDDETMSQIEEQLQVQNGGVIDLYLAELQKKISGLNGNPPPEYKKGTYWVETQFPSFVMKHKSDVNELYKPRIFLWLPQHLTDKQLLCPTCGSRLVSEGQTDIKARRILDIEE